jgi:hypothetical protein
MSRIEWVFVGSLIASATCGAVALAIPAPIPCGPQCKEISLRYTCTTGNAGVFFRPDCSHCGNGGCTVGGDTTKTCGPLDEWVDIDVYANGVQYCRACQALENYIEAFVYEGEYLTTLRVRRYICMGG